MARLAAAIVVAFLAMTVLRSGRTSALAWVLRFAIGLPLFGASLWIVLNAVPHGATLWAAPNGAQTFSLVATAVLIAGLAAEELIGPDVRRILGI